MTSMDDYQIRVKAKDDHGVQSEWSDSIPISMPHSKFLLFNGLYPESSLVQMLNK